MSTMYTPTPVTVTFPRPKCFCRYTAVSIYPNPTGEEDPLLKNNWVYECHFTPKQRGMAMPAVCDDCEEARHRANRRSNELMGPNTTSAEYDLLPSSSQDSTTTTTASNAKKSRQYKRHMAPMYDNVELWPRPSSSPPDHSSTTTSTTANNKDNKSLIGANIDHPSAFHGLSPLDHLRVCGFHMHALEWHHMQTMGIDKILRLADKTHCPVFNQSVVRWLGEHIRKPVTSTGTSTRTTTGTSITGMQSESKDNDAMSIIMGMDMKLFHKMGCLCKKEAALVRAPVLPPPTSLSSSLATFSHRGAATNTSSVQQEKQFWIVCRARAEAKSSFEIVDRGGSGGEMGNRNFPGLFGGTTTTSGSGSRSSRRGRKVAPAGTGMGLPGQLCSFGVPLEIANFGHNRVPIHAKVETNAWLSQWLSPPTSLPLSHPRPIYISTSSEQTVTAVRGLPATGSRLQQPVISPEPGPLVTTQHLERNERPWSTPFLYNEDNQSQIQERETRDHINDEHSRQQFVRWIEEVRRTEQAQQKCDLKGLDDELHGALAQHVKVLKSRIRVDEEGSSFEMQEDYVGSQFYKKVDMDATPTVKLQLCKDCKQGGREFCVIPRYRHDHGHHQLPPSPSHLIQLDVEMNINIDTGVACQVEAEAEVDQELKRVDRELEEVMTRHAEQVQRITEARSWLIPFFFECESCELRELDVDMLPCSHMVLCGQCLDCIEFYVVPREVL